MSLSYLFSVVKSGINKYTHLVMLTCYSPLRVPDWLSSVTLGHKKNQTGSHGKKSRVSRDFAKWCREHIQRQETDPISEEGQNLLEDTDRWRDQPSLLKECYELENLEKFMENPWYFGSW